MSHEKGPQIWVTRFCILLRNLTLLAILVVGAVLEIGVVGYLKEHPGWLTTALLVGGGMLLLGVASFMIPKFISKKPLAALLQLALLAVLVVVPVSAFKPGGITSARHGLTVVGWCPVPVFDLQFGADGRVWFRNKSHFIAASEVRGLADGGAEIVIVGTGWDPAVEVRFETLDVGHVKVEYFKNPEALETYRRLKAEGRRVALILHTTC